ncbi:hypothetical protein D1831_08460 [Lactiplantibacillus garii]|uniref:Uncharacterized protein n=1 Tax=Lactiplantibacillus garii TaxID=2306423 RepID=A0A3R8J7D7_9LACO|nr:hypothetical protein [Lactiplantibacillus garii]RRK10257.1 hypothetical protein D1831_08460 [Lactiplantibacillus garii]
MSQPLDPENMQSLLTHDRRYQRAAAVLNGQWQVVMAEETLPYRQRITRDDLQFARALLASGSLTSRFSFDSYAGVQAIRQHYGNLLSPAAQTWLVHDYV